jgi:hypothetical protein
MPASVERSARLPSIPLDPDHAARLARLAVLAGVPEATLAPSLLCAAIEDADPAASSTTAVLDGIPHFHQRAIQKCRARGGMAGSPTGRASPRVVTEMAGNRTGGVTGKVTAARKRRGR